MIVHIGCSINTKRKKIEEREKEKRRRGGKEKEEKRRGEAFRILKSFRKRAAAT